MLVKFEQNCIVQTTPKLWAVWQRTGFFKTILAKRWRYFGRRFCTMDWNKGLMLKYWFPDYHLSVTQCSKTYGNPTRVTRLKVAPNMADPISISKSLKCQYCCHFLLLCYIFIFLTKLVYFKWFCLMLYISTGVGHLLLYIYICIFSLLFMCQF